MLNSVYALGCHFLLDCLITNINQRYGKCECLLPIHQEQTHTLCRFVRCQHALNANEQLSVAQFTLYKYISMKPAKREDCLNILFKDAMA